LNILSKLCAEFGLAAVLKELRLFGSPAKAMAAKSQYPGITVKLSARKTDA